MKKITAGILGAAAVVASLVLVRQQRPQTPSQVASRPAPKAVPAGETVPADVTPERLRELGL